MEIHVAGERHDPPETKSSRPAVAGRILATAPYPVIAGQFPVILNKFPVRLKKFPVIAFREFAKKQRVSSALEVSESPNIPGFCKNSLFFPC